LRKLNLKTPFFTTTLPVPSVLGAKKRNDRYF
jgi:hypothetical protein